MDLTVDRAYRTVVYRGRIVAVSPRELAILEALLEHPGTPVSRMQLRERVYGEKEPGILARQQLVDSHGQQPSKRRAIYSMSSSRPDQLKSRAP